jgi:hypothetical protein
MKFLYTAIVVIFFLLSLKVTGINRNAVFLMLAEVMIFFSTGVIIIYVHQFKGKVLQEIGWALLFGPISFMVGIYYFYPTLY